MIGGSDLGFGIILSFEYNGTSAKQFQDDFAAITGKVQSGSDKLVNNLNLWNNVNFALQGVSSAMETFVGVGAAYDAQMHELSAITGVTGKDLEVLGNYARESALKFGGDAASNVEVFKRVLSDLGPDIAKSPEALNAMNDSIQRLGKTMGGDVVGAANALDGAMLQYGIDLSNPIEASKEMAKMANVMAASAKAGNVEVVDIAGALKQSGLMAKQSGLSFEEYNALLQGLGQGMIKSGEAGTAMRNIFIKMNAIDMLPKDALTQLANYGVDIGLVADKTVPFQDRLAELSKIGGDAGAMFKVFGAEGVAAAGTLFANQGKIEEFKNQITDTNTAFEMSETTMGSYSEKMSRIGARFKDLGISIFKISEGLLPGIQTAIDVGANITQMAPAFTLLNSAMTAFKANAIVTAFATGGLGAGFTVMGTAIASATTASLAFLAANIWWIVIGLAVIAVLGAIWYAVSEGIDVLWYVREAWDMLGRFIISMWNGMIDYFKVLGSAISDSFMGGIYELWDAIVSVFTGMFDWFSGIYESFLQIGTNIVTGIMDGIRTAWDGLVQMLTNLLLMLPGGELIYNALGGGSNVEANANTSGMQNPKAIGQTMAEQKALQAEMNQPTVFDKSTNSVQTETVQVNLNVDGDIFTEMVNRINSRNDSRK
jgi:TP901 family phage tail tape measure protein